MPPTLPSTSITCVARLTRRAQRTGGRRAGEQPLARLPCDDERVEVRQQADPSLRALRRLSVTGDDPSVFAVQVDRFQFVVHLVETTNLLATAGC